MRKISVIIGLVVLAALAVAAFFLLTRPSGQGTYTGQSQSGGGAYEFPPEREDEMVVAPTSQ